MVDLDQDKIPMLMPEHIPGYVTAADGSDFLMTVMVFFLIIVILGIGVGYLTLHAIPERLAHHANHSQLQIISILAVLALFTHNSLFWVAALVLATFKVPDYFGTLRSMARSLRRISLSDERATAPESEPMATAAAAPTGHEQG